MVWGLFPVHPSSGEEKHYIYAKGTYKVGRKGCDLNLNDRGISRIHAEIIVDAVESLEPNENKSPNFFSKVRIRDLSKYGTFYERNGMKKKILDCPSREIYLRDGDLVTFGSGNVIYRFCFVPLIFYLCNFTSSQATPTQAKVSSIGACVSHCWTTECTHVIVDSFKPVTEELLDIILCKKPVVLSTWVEFVSSTRIHNEIPSYSQYLPTLTLDGRFVTVADTKTRETSLKGYTFVLGSANMYRFHNKLQSLLVVAGAKVLSVTEFSSNRQDLVETYNFLVLVIPAENAEQFCPNSILSKVNEINLIFAIISGHLDPSILISPSIVVSSSCSTDETVVAESDEEIDIDTSNHRTMINAVVANVCDESEMQTFKKHAVSLSEDALSADLMQLYKTKIIGGKEATKYRRKDEQTVNQDASLLGDGKVTSVLEPMRAVTTVNNEDLEYPDLDIVYSEKLIVRGINARASAGSVTDGGIVNFKRFRKTNTQYGNSFSNLVLFSKHPYGDSNYGEKLNECVKEEKRRKQMEAVAEDLFNNEKARRRGVSGSIRELLSHR